MAEALNSLFKAELIRNRGPWKGIDDLEIAERLPAMVEHHPNSTATRLPQPRRAPRPNNRHRLEFN